MGIFLHDESSVLETNLLCFDFLHYILLPYVAFLLIQEDLGCSSVDAWDAWEKSKEYVEAQFPGE